ncbi:MAG: homoserine kinase [Eubacteriales bacterium]|jgi:homoserine kinase|nr:homoserine kinase [Eubacteriales bacterium]MDD4134934.1 homoserine kinase [Eubacteriales bacterium]NLO13378.1 homoserine kinase [Clostridiales bacterium]
MVTIRVPASCANLGPGFDCLGMALGLYADIRFGPREGGLVITGCPPVFSGEDNLAYRAFLLAAKAFGKKAPGLEVDIRSDIPPARGLGSSAACITAGILAAGALLGVPLSPEELLVLSAGMEGHPDNAAAAVYGGLRVSVMAGKAAHSLPVFSHPGLSLLALVPDFPLETSKARRALPEVVSRKDAVFNLSRAALLVKALETGAFHLLKEACRDRLHQPWRFPLIPQGEEAANLALEMGADACFISGAGPSLMCLHHDKAFPGRMAEYLRAFPAWRALPLCIAPKGAEIITPTAKGQRK